MSKANEDLLANELNDIVDSADETEDVVEKKIEYTKTGRVKQAPKPRTEAQIEAFAKARAKWSEMRRESTKSKNEANLKSRELTMEKKKKEANVICEKAQKRYDKAKSKILPPDKMPLINEDKKTEIPIEDEEEEAPPVIIKKTRKKKPVVIVDDGNSESELESDDPHIIFVKRKAKAKPAEPPPPPTNPFGKPYFYSTGAMS